MNSFGDSKGQSDSKPVTVMLRISENELRKSCNNLQELRDETDKENNVVVDLQSCSSDNSDKLPAQQRVFPNNGYEDFENTSSINTPLNADISSRRDDANLCKNDLTATNQPNNKVSTPPSNAIGGSCPLEDEVNIGGQDCLEKAAATYPVLPVPRNLTEHVVEHASSPCSSDSSDDVFTSTRDKFVPAMHRGDFKKPRRPFKSDSSVFSTTESPVMKETPMSDSSMDNCKVESTAISQSTKLFTSNNIKEELTGATNSVKVAIVSTDTDSNSKVVTEVVCSTKNASENSRVSKTSTTGNNEMPEGMKEGVPCSLQTENWRERPPVDLTEPQNNNFDNIISSQNWRERKNYFSSTDLWTSRSHCENWRSKKSMSVDETARDVDSMLSGHSKRYSTGDIQLERQDANEKGLFISLVRP